MFSGIREFIFGNYRKAEIDATKKVVIQGITFEIKKISPISYMAGIDSLMTFFATYEDKRDIEKLINSENGLPVKKIREHYKNVFLAGVVRPRLVAKDDGIGTLVDTLLDDWMLCNELYVAINNYTYGQKKKTWSMFPKLA